MLDMFLMAFMRNKCKDFSSNLVQLSGSGLLEIGRQESLNIMDFFSLQTPRGQRLWLMRYNYMLFEHNLQIQLVPPEKIHPKLWKGINRTSKLVNFTEIKRRRHNKGIAQSNNRRC